MNPSLLVLAAGLGNRYGGLKQIDGVGPSNETILEYSVYDAIRTGFTKVIFVIQPTMQDPFENSIARKFNNQIEIGYAHQTLDMLPNEFSLPQERIKPWGTGHAILVAKNTIQEPFAVINADDFYGLGSFQALANFLQTARDDDIAEYSMVGYILQNTLSEHGSVSRGICNLHNDYLETVTERTKITQDRGKILFTDEVGKPQSLTGNEIVSLNLWGFTPSIFTHLENQFANFLRETGQNTDGEFFIPSVISNLIETNKARVKVLPSPESWFGMTYKKDKLTVQENIRQLVSSNTYPSDLWASLLN